MAGIICHHKDRYNIYCTIADGFIFESSLSLEQLKIWTEKEYGKDGLIRLPDRLNRAHTNGHSSLIDNAGLDEMLCCNRAGENETRLSVTECIKRFLS